jgi:archaeosine-15-forming tRNA-guanine transglycosylase
MSPQIQLASSYSLLDPEQRFALMEAITKQLNELVAAASVMDGFDHRYLKNGEWMANGHSTLGNMVGTLRRSLGHFARVDFDRAQVLSEQLERPEIRLMAQVDIAQIVLNGQNVKLGLGRTFRHWHKLNIRD